MKRLLVATVAAFTLGTIAISLSPTSATAASSQGDEELSALKTEIQHLREENALLRERERLRKENQGLRVNTQEQAQPSPAMQPNSKKQVSPKQLSHAAEFAYAADLPTKAPRVFPVYNTWGGFYVGAHAGAGLGSDGIQSMADPAAGLIFGGFDPVTFGSSAKLGAVGGIQLGYNWQPAPAWLLGVEGDFSFASLHNSNSTAPLTAAAFTAIVPGSSLSMSADVKWLSSIRGRVGYIWDNDLLYLTGGAAWKNTDFRSQLVALAPFVSQTNFNKTQSGWVLGGGVDRMLTANWIIGAQYLFYHFGTESAGAVFTPGGTLPIAYTWKDNVHVLRADLAYKF